MSFRHRGTALVVILLVTAAACGGDDSADSGPGTDPGAGVASDEGAAVTIEAFDFQPDPLVVPVGTTITFSNGDAIDHTVTAGTREAPTPEVFDGTLPEEGATFELTLDEAGTYEYFCRIHQGPGMTAVITVE